MLTTMFSRSATWRLAFLTLVPYEGDEVSHEHSIWHVREGHSVVLVMLVVMTSSVTTRVYLAGALAEG